MENPRKVLILLTSVLFLAASAAWTAWPVSAPAAAITPAPTPFGTLPSTPVPQGGPPLSLTLTLLFTCCALGAVVGVIVLGFVLSLERRKAAENEKQPPP